MCVCSSFGKGHYFYHCIVFQCTRWQFILFGYFSCGAETQILSTEKLHTNNHNPLFVLHICHLMSSWNVRNHQKQRWHYHMHLHRLKQTSTQYKPMYLIREIPFDLMGISALFMLINVVPRNSKNEIHSMEHKNKITSMWSQIRYGVCVQELLFIYFFYYKLYPSISLSLFLFLSSSCFFLLRQAK